MVLSDFFLFFFIYFLFFRRQGFRMITFDRQAGPLQNFNRSHVMVIGRSVSVFFPTPRDPRVGAWAPQTPQNPPPPETKYLCMRFRTPGTFLKKKISREKKLFFCVLGPQEDVFAKKKSVTKKFQPVYQCSHYK